MSFIIYIMKCRFVIYFFHVINDIIFLEEVCFWLIELSPKSSFYYPTLNLNVCVHQTIKIE